MYARVATFQSDTSQVDELIEMVKERAGSGQDLPEAQRFFMLVDRDAGSSVGVTFFETEDAIHRAEPAFERMGDEIPEELDVKRTSVGIYEVVIEDMADGASAARLSSLAGPPDRIDDGIAFIKEQILPAATDIAGWRGIVVLVDREGGATKTITFWDSVDSREASEERAHRLRSEAAAAMDETIVGVDRYEVALSKVLTPTPA